MGAKRMLKITAFLAVFGAFSISPTIAQVNPVLERLLSKRLGTTTTVANPVFSDGMLTGCTVVFGALIKDFTYKAGNYVRVDGSFSLMTANSNLAVMLKVVLHDLEPKSMNLTPSPPVNAFFVSDNSTSRSFLINQSSKTDTPGAIVTIYNAEKTFPMLFQGVSDGVVTIAFARSKGGIEVQVPIDLSIEDTDDEGTKRKSEKTATKFSSCISSLLTSEKDRLRKAK